MGELVRRDDPQAIQRAREKVILPALGEAVADVHIAANSATRYVAERIVAETSAIERDTVFERVAPHSDALIEQAANNFRQLAQDATNQMRRNYNGFR